MLNYSEATSSGFFTQHSPHIQWRRWMYFFLINKKKKPGQQVIIPMPLNPFSFSLASWLHRQQALEQEHAAGKYPCDELQWLTPHDKSLEAEQKQTENIYYLNDRALWQAGRQATSSNTGRGKKKNQVFRVEWISSQWRGLTAGGLTRIFATLEWWLPTDGMWISS